MKRISFEDSDYSSILAEASNRSLDPASYLMRVHKCFTKKTVCDYCGKEIKSLQFFPFCSYKCMILVSLAGEVKAFADRERMK